MDNIHDIVQWLVTVLMAVAFAMSKRWLDLQSKRIEDLEKEVAIIDKRTAVIETKIASAKEHLDRRFDGLDKNFDKLFSRFEQYDRDREDFFKSFDLTPKK